MMPGNKGRVLCRVCNPEGAGSGDYCEEHREEIHRLDHQYDSIFRLQRTSRGKDHESYQVFFQNDCDPCGRILATETDPENLSVTVILTHEIDVEALLPDYASLSVQRTIGDKLRDLIKREIIHSWYGNARACVDIFRTPDETPIHWDVDPRDAQTDDDAGDVEPGEGTKHSIH